MLLRRSHADGLVVLQSPRLAAAGVPHLFTTRRGAGGELDAGELSEGQVARLLRAIGAPRRALFSLRQVHGAEVARAEADVLPPEPPAADAAVTARVDRALLVRSADCVPILVANADGRRVAAVHAGWRGLVAQVLPRALEFLGEPSIAAIGPCLSRAGFEVGEEVAAAFDSAELGACVDRGLGAKPHVDLRGAALLQLERAGVREVDVCERCTWDDPELWSHRRDVTHGGAKRTGRLAALIATA